ncbi:hypothetical protein MM35RIKEN_22190 (plasmid) [Vescimonas fastidiosa]|uniref:Uncharacterized protein n=1 Tax=Vescimonas fastidiosa TaxID=2714353 RepID=A0A810Q176_9FIRM|nr:hypothetical protein MM35RIKEN_22190 [Vescimonas fastidiosa]
MGILLHRKYKSKDKNTAKAHRVWGGGLVRMSKDSFFSGFELYARTAEPGIELIFYGVSNPMHST